MHADAADGGSEDTVRLCAAGRERRQESRQRRQMVSRRHPLQATGTSALRAPGRAGRAVPGGCEWPALLETRPGRRPGKVAALLSGILHGKEVGA